MQGGQSKETMKQGEQLEEIQATGSSSEVESHENSSTEEASPNLPITLKKEVARKTLSKGNLEHYISNYVTYEAYHLHLEHLSHHFKLWLFLKTGKKQEKIQSGVKP